jgi:hypothetical protein
VVPDTAAPSGVLPAEPAGGTDPERWRDDLWVAVVGSIDAVLRSYYDIVEYTDDPRCIFRLGLSPARAPLVLADGTTVQTGEPVGTLHFWNEHLPRYRSGGPELHWAAEMRRRLQLSLRALAGFVEMQRDWREVRAFRGEAALSSRRGTPQLARLARRYGFERIPFEPSLARRLHMLGECAIAWGLARAFNPAALSRQHFFRPHHALWISRTALLRLHARPARGIAHFAADES